MHLLVCQVVGSNHSVIEETWGSTISQLNSTVVYSEKENIESLAGKAQFYLVCSNTTYVHVPNLLSLLLSFDYTDKVTIIGKCKRYQFILCSNGFLENKSGRKVFVDGIYGCNYSGLVDGERCCPRSDLDKLIICSNMSDAAMNTLHIYYNFHPIIPRTPSEDNGWTLVTGFFDLTKKTDATSFNRPANHYLEAARGTLSLNYNLVIFCEPEYFEEIKAIRSSYGLMEKTKFYVMQLEDFPLSKYHNTIAENRVKHPYEFDKRNNPSYYLLCMSRYAMLKTVIQDNPFKSEFFCWINFCIIRMGLRNLEFLPQCLNTRREKFSTLYIDYVPQFITDNLPRYYEFGRCSMCSGFFTGNAKYMLAFCDAIEKKFEEVVKQGYGHADEQLYSLVYFDKPDIFENYYGDYQAMITNYNAPMDNLHTPIFALIKNCINNHEYGIAFDACEKIMETYKKGRNELTCLELCSLFVDYFLAAWWLRRYNICKDLAKNIMMHVERDPNFKEVVEQNLIHVLSAFDLINLLESTPKYIAIYTPISDQQIKEYTTKGKVFIYYSDVITDAIFITNNPVIRPLSAKYQVKYDLEIK